ncbi:hypothetical protein NL108_014760 [Boleophthalmus pectinirostris]|uniref:receptor-type tyrosine-protein phosphatase C-like n=1 Tax=Boleophthalmus pectinirostris TaxID=150288 RepID=UPI0024313A3A|nr:receptor-type tyrosine-protein phosphatase C-like [Boleophthalmus pectinirostris]XP_055021139.1 receptor-type tyrosine-protein phosphatase C-like [Boleophthalmus pectinirostris]KAJ0065652.1 hypothetical protein NL108_014760 [Boleophthalmus pectinirostris]
MGALSLLLWAGVIALSTSPTRTTAEDPDKDLPCEFEVQPVQFGLQIGLKNPKRRKFNVTVSEQNGDVIERQFSISTQSITRLKPCTEYTVRLQRAGGVTCTGTDNVTTAIRATTTNMKPGDFMFAPHSVGKISINTKWKLTCSDVSALGAEAQLCPGAPQTCCVSVTNQDLCSNLSVTFNNPRCPFTDTVPLPAETFLSVANLNQKVTKYANGHPLEIKFITPLPKKCNLTTDYNCVDTKNIYKALSALEPFKKYTCVGNITNEKFSTKTDPIEVDTDCNLHSLEISSTSTENSTSLQWKPKTKNCNVTLLKPKLKYKCTCTYDWWHRKFSEEMSSEQKCTVKGLEAWTRYDCKIQTFYDEDIELKQHEKTVRTEAGTPDNPGKLIVYLTENNSILVNCSGTVNFRGPMQKYKAVLKDDQKNTKVLESHKCHFNFRDLKFSSTYVVEVKAFNGEHESTSSYKTVNTGFNDKALIGFLVFLILLTSVPLLLVLYKICVLNVGTHRESSH